MRTTTTRPRASQAVLELPHVHDMRASSSCLVEEEEDMLLSYNVEAARRFATLCLQ